MSLPTNFSEHKYFYLGITALCGLILVFAVGYRIKGAEAQNIDSAPDMKVEAVTVTNVPYEWVSSPQVLGHS